MCFVCLVRFFTSQTAMVMARQSDHLTTLASLTKLLTRQYFVHILLFVTDNNTSRINRRRGNYFMINLYKSMGPGWNWTCSPWICSQTCYRLSFVVRYKVCVKMRRKSLRLGNDPWYWNFLMPGYVLLYSIDKAQTVHTLVSKVLIIIQSSEIYLYWC